MFLVIDGLQIPVALNQATRSERVTAGEITEMFDASLQSSGRGVTRVWEIPTHPLALTTARALEGLASGLRRVKVWGDAVDTDSTAPIEAFIRLDRLRLGGYADGARRAFTVSVTEAEPWHKALNWESGFPALGTFSRASTAFYIDEFGVLQEVAVDEARVGHVVSDGVFGIDAPGWLLEPARTNQISNPTAFGSWTLQAMSVTADATTVQGVAVDKLIPNTSNTVHYVANATAASATSGDVVKMSAWVAKGGGYNRGRLTILGSGAFTVGQEIAYNLNDETVVNTAGTATGAIEHIGGDLYRVDIFATADATGVVSVRLYVTNASGDTGFAGDGTSGLYVWLAVVEFDSEFAGSPYTASSRAAETLSRTLPSGFDAPTASSFYIRWRSPYATNGGISTPRIFQISAAGGASPRLILYWLSSTQLRAQFQTTTGSVTSTITLPSLAGETLDALVRLYPDGSVQLTAARDGGTAVEGTRSGPLALPAAWSGATWWINSDGSSFRGAMTVFALKAMARALTGDGDQALRFARYF